MNSDDAQLFAESIMNVVRDAKGAECFFSDITDPCGKVIRSHSIQNSYILDQITESGHVAMLSFDPEEGVSFNTNISRNNASVFKGVCNRHDTNLFQEIDFSANKTFNRTNKRQLHLLALRGMYKELFLKKNVIKTFSALISVLKSKDQNGIVKILPFTAKFKGNFPFDEIDVSILELNLLGQYLAIIDQNNIYTDLTNDITNENYESVEHVVIESSKVIKWAASGISSPNFLLDGTPIFINNSGPPQHLVESQYRLAQRKEVTLEEIATSLHSKTYNYQLMIFNSFPFYTRSFSILSYRRNDSWMQRLASDINGGDASDRELNLSRCILSNLENIVFKASVVMGLGKNRLQKIQKEFGETTFPGRTPSFITTNLFEL